MAEIAVCDAQQSLSIEFGTRGARLQLLSALRDGSLVASCERFAGLNANRFSTLEYPKNGETGTIPSSFWAHDCWIEDGEHSWHPYDKSRDTWTASVSWQEGNFLLNGTWASGRDPFSRRAYGVKLQREALIEFCKHHGVSPKLIWNGGRPPHEYLVQWCKISLQNGRFTGQRGAETAAFEDFGIGMRPAIRDALAEAQSQI